MSDSTVQSRESLSALKDGEASEFELRKVLQTLTTDSELRKQWHRYHLAAAIIRREVVKSPDLALCDRIQAALNEEPAHGTSPVKRLIQPLSRFAVAASVAALAIVGVQQYTQLNGASEAALAKAEPEVAHDRPATPLQLPSAFSVPRVPVRTVSATAGGIEPVVVKQADPISLERQKQVELYLNQLMQRHSENSALNSSQGMLPFARMPVSNVDNP